MFRFFKNANYRWVENEPEDKGFTELIKRYVFREPGLLDEEVEEATAFLQHLQTRNLWVACDCTDIATRPGISAKHVPSLHVVDGKNLRRQHARPKHDGDCDFIKRRGKGKPADASEAKTISISLARDANAVPTSYGVFRRFSVPTEGFVRHDTERRNGKQLSTHARLLFTLLSKAKLNVWAPGKTRAKLPGQLHSIRVAAQKLEIGPGISVGDVIVSYPNKVGLKKKLSLKSGVPDLLQRVRAQEHNWPMSGRPHGFLCSVAAKFEGNDIVFEDKNRFNLLAHPQIFAEYREKSERPYIAIVSFAKDRAIGSDYLATGCFAQPCVSREDCGPVDSSYEERTLQILLQEQAIAFEKGSYFNIVKPLFDIVTTDDHGEVTCRPDFIIEFEIGDRTILLPVETMGRDTKEYNRSKKNSHPRMRSLNHRRELVKHNCTSRSKRGIEMDNEDFRDDLNTSLQNLNFYASLIK